jgi:glycosyltransferase involved in cell wall biosynthesis
MLGQNTGWVLSQGEIQANLFAGEGYPVRVTSTSPNRVLRLADTVRSLLAWRRSVDVIVLMVFSGPAFGLADMASLLAKKMNKPLVLWLHGGNLPDFARRYPGWVGRVVRRGDALVSPSGYLADFFQRWGLAVRVIPNVLDIGQYPYRQRSRSQPRLLWMRTFHRFYQPEMALAVLAEVQQAYPGAILTMAGQDKGLKGRVMDRASRQGLADRVRFVGFLDAAGKQREFATHDIFLNTNRVDNAPVSLIEAAAYGLPIVTTAAGGIPHLLRHEETGLLVDVGDVPGMSRAVKRLLREPDLVSRLSGNGRDLAETFAWPRVKLQWDNLLAGLMADA